MTGIDECEVCCCDKMTTSATCRNHNIGDTNRDCCDSELVTSMLFRWCGELLSWLRG